MRTLTSLTVMLVSVACLHAQPKTDLAGDALPPDALMRLGSNRFTHSASLNQIAFTADAKHVVFVGMDGVVGRWATADGRDTGRHTIPVSGGRVALISADGSVGVQIRAAQRVVLVDMATGKERFAFPGNGNRTPVVAWGRGGQTLLFASGNDVQVWEVAGQRQMFHWTTDPINIYAVAGSPDGKRMALADGTGEITLRDVESGKVIQTLAKAPGVRLGRGASESLTFSPDGKWLTVLTNSQRLVVWDLATGTRLAKFAGTDHNTAIRAPAWSPDGKFFAFSGTDLKVRVREVATGKEIAAMESLSPIRSLRFSPDGRYLAGLGSDRCPEIWELVTQKPLVEKAGHRGQVNAIAFAATGRIVTGGMDTQLYEWDLKTGRPTASYRAMGNAIRAVAAGDSAVAFVHGGQLFTWQPGGVAKKVPAWEPPAGLDAALSADGRVYVSLTENGKLQCFDAANGKMLGAISVAADEDPNLILSPDGRLLSVRNLYDESTQFRISRTLDGRFVRSFGVIDEYPETAVFAPSGHCLAAALDTGHIRMWELATGTSTLINVLKGHPSALAFSPDSRILYIGMRTGELQAYDVACGGWSELRPAHRGRVSAFAVSPDGTTLVSGSADTTALVWNAARFAPKVAPAAPPQAGDLARWWKDLSVADGDAGRKALAGFVASPKESLPFLKEHIKPPALPPRDRIAGWLRDLDNTHFATREKASHALAGLGEDAVAFLRDADAKATTAEGRRRIELLLRDAESQLSAANLQLLRGLDALEMIGEADAKTILEGVANASEETWLKREARAAVGRVSAAR